MAMRLCCRDFSVNCRIGSLEIRQEQYTALGRVNCRIGSLEKLTVNNGRSG